MTPKENLYLKLLTTKNELYKVEGKSERIINLAEFVDTREFKRNVRTFKVNELKEQIESAKKKAERLVWFATDDGKAFRDKTEKKMREMWEMQESLTKETRSYVQGVVHHLLGENFEVTGFGNNGFNIYMTKGYSKEELDSCHFTPSFFVYCEKHIGSNVFRWELDYTSSGTYELGADMIRTNFLVGLAKFVSNKEVLDSLKERMESYYDQYRTLERERYRLHEKLEDYER
ncbi:MAG: hypothetical protein IKN58_13755 [Prevotella sp.]|nr:hypothetical protein [Prevotella sp.]MBR3658226.1 hypothetical protein [Prevotella sp.]